MGKSGKSPASKAVNSKKKSPTRFKSATKHNKHSNNATNEKDGVPSSSSLEKTPSESASSAAAASTTTAAITAATATATKTATAAKKQKYPNDTLIYKSFQGYEKPFRGKVVGYDDEIDAYRIKYEDSDSEELDEEEVGMLLLNAVVTKNSKRNSAAGKRRKSTEEDNNCNCNNSNDTTRQFQQKSPNYKGKMVKKTIITSANKRIDLIGVIGLYDIVKEVYKVVYQWSDGGPTVEYLRLSEVEEIMLGDKSSRRERP